MRYPALTFLLTATLALTACDNRPSGDQTGTGGDADGQDALTPDPQDPVSIIRPDIEQPDTERTPLEPLRDSIAFPEGGDALDQVALSRLREILRSEQVAKGGQITLRGHSDAGGSDAANLRASRSRAESVRDWLVENGIDASRIRVIAFGEQNPIEPNALPDGSPNEAGRSANRRVDIEVSLMSPDAPPIMDEANTRSGR